MDRLVPSYIERLSPYRPGKPVDEVERELGIPNAIKLASNENPNGPSPAVLEVLRAVDADLSRYPDAAAYALRRALAEHHGVSMDDICVGNGSNDLIDIACRCFVSPSDHAVIPDPSFVCYALGLLAANVPFTAVKLVDHRRYDVESILSAVRDDTRLLFVANPNNPTGAHISREQLRRLLERLPERVLVVVDEAYVEFADAPDFETALAMRSVRERLLVLRTFSKAYGLAALRVGYGIGSAQVVNYVNRVRAPFNVNTLAQRAAIAALRDPEHVRRYVAENRSERARVSSGLEALGLLVTPSQANFVLVDFRRSADAVAQSLLRLGVIVRPMPAPIETCCRITVGLPAENDRLLVALTSLELRNP